MVTVTNDECMWRCLNSKSSFRHNDHWIGLKRGLDLNCICEDDPDIDCYMCRESWKWVDGSPMAYRYKKWRTGFSIDPGIGGCGRLNLLGWADMRCNYTFRYICERYDGKIMTYTLFFLTNNKSWVHSNNISGLVN